MGRLRNYPAAIIFLEFKFCGISIVEKRGFKNNLKMVIIEITTRSLLYSGSMLNTQYVLSHLTFWRRKWQPTPVFLPRESPGQRRLAGYSAWGSQSWTWPKRLRNPCQIPSPPFITGEVRVQIDTGELAGVRLKPHSSDSRAPLYDNALKYHQTQQTTVPNDVPL